MVPLVGIYGIFCTNTGKVYVGQSLHCTRRKWNHFSQLRCGTHSNSYLQRAFNKHGEAAFEFRILEVVPPDMLLVRERSWIAYYNSVDEAHGYNATDGGEHVSARDEDTNKRIAEAQRRAWHKPGYREQMSAKLSAAYKKSARFGVRRIFSEDTKRRMSEAAKRRVRGPHSEATRRKMSESALRFVAAHGPPKMSKESRKKQGESLRRNRNLREVGSGTSALHQ